MLKLIRFLKGHRLSVVAAPLFKLTEALFELILPLVVARILDAGIPSGNTRYIVMMCAVMLLLGIAGYGFSIVCQYLAARASMGFGTNVRSAVFSKVAAFGYAETDKFGSAGLVTRLTNDINQTQHGISMFIRLVLRSPFIAVGAIVMAMTIDIKLSLIFFAMSLLVSVVLYLVTVRSTPYYRSIQKSFDNIALLTSENLSGARVVRAFSNQREEEEDFKTAASQLSAKGRRVGRISGLINPLTFALVNIAIIGVLYFGGIEVNLGHLTQGQILALVNYLSQILLSLVVLANLIVVFTKASACAKRINEVLDTDISVKQTAENDPVKTDGAPKLEFKNVTFTYNGNPSPSLKDISFKLECGGTLGVIGPTGSGKSTLIGLIGRNYDVSGGAVLIDGADVKNYTFKGLRSCIGLVPQRAALFSGTIRDNLVMGRTDLTDDDLYIALKTAMAYEFVMTLEKGLDATVLRDGRNFSGGQRQRLTVARALAQKPDILILDDSSSALDYATDLALRTNIKNYHIPMTVIIVSQRAVSISGADQILVLEEGRCVGLGNHDSLIKSCPLYAEICSLQDGGSEEGGDL